MDCLRRLGRERQAAVIVVTHDDRMLEDFDRVYRMTDGRISTGERLQNRTPAEALVGSRE
jgi:putative ABC transport system ATP-binding protein